MNVILLFSKCPICFSHFTSTKEKENHSCKIIDSQGTLRKCQYFFRDRLKACSSGIVPRQVNIQNDRCQLKATNQKKKTSKNYHSPSLILIFTPALQHLSAENDTCALVWGIQLFPVALSSNPINPVTPTKPSVAFCF